MTALPFDPRPEAAELWLAELKSLPARARGRQLYNALQALNRATLAASSRLPLLESLRPAIFATSEILAREFIHLATPLTDSARSTAKLSIFLHHELAVGYEHLLTGAVPVAGQRVLASLGWMLVRILQLGEPVGSSVWHRLYTLYRQGEAEGWLSVAVPEPLSGSEETPWDRFKCAITFVALAPMRFEPQSMSELFLYLYRHREAVELSATRQMDGWCIDLARASGPRRANRSLETDGPLLYLSMRLPPAEGASPALVQRLRHHLGKPLSAEEYQYPLTRRVDELWCGRESVLAELRRRQSRSSSPGTWLEIPEFELAPLDNEPSTATTTLSPEDRSNRVHRRLDAQLRRRQDDPVAVLEAEGISARAGDLAVLKLLDETLVAAVVRWVQTGVHGSRIRLGLDQFEGAVEYIQTIIPGQGSISAVWIMDAQQEAAVLILPPIRIKPGVDLAVGERETRVTRLLEWTDDFCAYRLTCRTT